MASRFQRFLGLLSPASTPRGGVFLTLTTALVAICAVFAIVMLDMRDHVRQAAESAGLNLATALSQDVARNVEMLSLSIEAARDSWQEPQVRALDPDLRQKLVFDHSTTARYIEAIQVVSADGTVIADSRMIQPRQRNYSDRDFFRAQQDHDVGLFVSAPMLGRDGKGWHMAFSRRITSDEGSFAGIAVGFLNLEYLSDVYKQLRLESEGRFSLLNVDGTMLVREPASAGAVGQSMRGRAVFEAMVSADRGVFEGRSRLDGQQRLFAFQRVGSLPLIQVVGQSTDAVYAEWRGKAVMLGGTLAVLCAGTLALLFLLKSELKQRVVAENALQHWATQDDLTGLLNRRRFFELAEQRHGHPSAQDASFSVLMIDADHFKHYNDHHGHLAGDAVLAAIGRCIDGEMRRATDLAARYGGEEFIALAPGTDRAQAFVIAEAIRTAVERLAIPHERATAGIVTVSIGLATRLAGTNVRLATVVEAADAALYGSKRAGRNRSMAADNPASPALVADRTEALSA